MKTSFSRTVVTFTLILLVVLFIVSFSFQVLVKKHLTDQAVDNLKNCGSTVSQVAAAYYADNTMSERDFLIQLSVSAEIAQADVVICDANGRLVLCSDAPFGCEHQNFGITSPGYVQQVASQNVVVSKGIISGLYEESRHIVSTAIRQRQNGPMLGIVLVSAPVISSNVVMERFLDNYIFLAVFVALAAFVILLVYTKKSGRSLRVMAKTANAFGHGNLQARVQLPKGAPLEFQELALAFNNMAGELEKSEYQRKEFVANVSHELKTPMTTIGGYVDGILDGTIPENQQDRCLQIVSSETRRLSRLVKSMLDISRLQEQGEIPETHKTRFDVCECVGKVLITFEQKINQKSLQVSVDMPELPVFTRANEDAITQVVYNLLDNAVKFCPETGVLGVTVRVDNRTIYVSVSNSGQTIPPQELPLLFDRFHKLDKSRSENRDGWGLGLYIVKTIIGAHGQDLSVSSAEGVTEFTFTLPIVN